MPRELEQPRQDVVVAVGADQQIGVETFEQVTHAQQQLATALALEAVVPLIDLHQQVVAMPAMGILQFSIQAQRHHAQRRQRIFHFPGRVQRLDVSYVAVLMLDGAPGQRKDIAHQHVALRQGDVGVVVGQMRIRVGDLLEERRQHARNAHADLEHLQVLIQEQIAAFGAAQFHRRAAGAQHLAQRAQFLLRTAGVEGGNEAVAEDMRSPLLIKEPDAHSIAGGVGVEEPTVKRGHLNAPPSRPALQSSPAAGRPAGADRPPACAPRPALPAA